MKGTEKQIGYAQDMIKKFETEMDAVISICPDELKEQWIEGKAKIAAILKDGYAGDVIHLIKGIEKSGMNFYQAFYSRVMVNGDETARRIKKEVWGK